MEDELLPASRLAARLSIPVQTLYTWERRGWLTSRGLRPRLYSLAQAAALRAPAGLVPLELVADVVGVTTNKLRALARAGRIPPLEHVRPRLTLAPADYVPRIKAWFEWKAAPKYGVDYSPSFKFEDSYNSMFAFEHNIATGQIPGRFAAAHYDQEGNYHA